MPENEETVTISNWGKDHWSTFAYIECRVVDYKGVLHTSHMRTDPKLHPQFAHQGSTGGPFATRLKKGSISNHDDWSCADDLEAQGLVENTGTGIHRVYRLTEKGSQVAAQLRKHKANGGAFATFSYGS